MIRYDGLPVQRWFGSYDTAGVQLIVSFDGDAFIWHDEPPGSTTPEAARGSVEPDLGPGTGRMGVRIISSQVGLNLPGRAPAPVFRPNLSPSDPSAGGAGLEEAFELC